MICRCCETPLDKVFLDLGPSPVSNAFLSKEDLEKPETYIPLKVYVCESCYLVQLGNSVPAAEIFNENYAYFSSYSSSWLEHAKNFAEHATEKLGLKEESRVVEIASNDGYLLQYFKEKGIPVIGVEPTANTAAVGKDKGIPTYVEFFGREFAKSMVDKGESADLIIANNVVAHVPDLHDFLGGFKALLKPSGTIAWEFPHLLNLIEQRQFDTIYTEHFSYFSLYSFEKALAQHDLKVVDVEELPTHGGSLRVYAMHTAAKHTAAEHSEAASSRRVQALREREAGAGIAGSELYDSFAEEVARIRDEAWQFFASVRKQGKKVAAYGAPAKGNTFLNFAGIRPDSLHYTVDRSPAKQGKYLPGSRIPVFAPEHLLENKPDYIFILPWNLEKEITHDLRSARDWGAKFVTAIPSLRIF